MLPLIGILAAMLPPILPQAGNIVARFSAASIAQGDNTAVTTWTDSIAGVQATQGTGVNQPKYMVSSAGGKPLQVSIGYRLFVDAGAFERGPNAMLSRCTIRPAQSSCTGC